MKTGNSCTNRITLFTGIMLTFILTGTAMARVNVDLNVNIGPPPIVVPAPPAVVLMPNYGVYYVPEVEFDVFFHNGYWWSPRGDRWYRSRDYNGPWRIIERRYVPRAVVRVPRDYRGKYGHERQIPYGEWRERHNRGDRHEMRGRDEHHEREERREHERGRDRDR